MDLRAAACVFIGPLYAGLTCHDTSWKCEECWGGNTPVRCIRFPPPVVVAPIVKRCCTGLVASDYRFPQPDCGIWSTISGNMRLLRPSLFLCSKLLLDNSKTHTHTHLHLARQEPWRHRGRRHRRLQDRPALSGCRSCGVGGSARPRGVAVARLQPRAHLQELQRHVQPDGLPHARREVARTA